MKELLTYFPELSARQHEQFQQLAPLYRYWNERINVISRKNIDFLYHNHVLPSLAFYKAMPFTAGTQVIDVGTGGGFPGIPLAIAQPQVPFTLIDATRKKVQVVQEISRELNLTNVTARQVFSKELKQRYAFVLGRAVKPFNEFYQMVEHLVDIKKQQNSLPNGIGYLTGGSVKEELTGFSEYMVFDLAEYFSETHLADKRIIYYPM